MPYRTSARKAASDTAVACRACGALASIVREDQLHETFRCARCDREQPALRAADDLEVVDLAVVEVKGGSYEQLSPLLAELGAPGKAVAVDLRCDGIRCDVSLSINSGSVMGLDMAAYTAGLPPMHLLRESYEHADHKERGIVSEVQTGDAAFDDEVYIESAASDADVRTVLASPAVRAAARKLVGSAGKVTIAESGVALHVSKDDDAFDPAAVRARLGLLRVLAGAPRPLVVEHVPVPALATWTKTLTYVTAPLAILLLFVGLARYTPISGRPSVVGFVAGLVLASFLAPVFTLLLRGRSTSHREILACRVVAFVFLPLFTVGALMTSNGVMDRSPERMVVMPIVSTSVDDEDDGLLHVETVDDLGERHRYSFRNTSLRAGSSRVTVRWRSGALGWTWETGDAVATE